LKAARDLGLELEWLDRETQEGPSTMSPLWGLGTRLALTLIGRKPPFA
jgi:hypothetical protein